MKIVHCIFTMKTGGAQILTIDLLNGFCETNEVYLIIVNDQWNASLIKEINPAVKIIYINRKEGSRNPYHIYRFNKILRSLKPDVVHCHEYNMLRFLIGDKLTIVYTIHDVAMPVENLKKCSALVAISNIVANDVYDRSGLKPHIIYNGIKMQAFNRRVHYTLDSNEKVKIVQVSRLLHEKKGQNVLIKAIHKLVYKYDYKNILLEFVGDGVSLPFLKDLVSELNLNEYILFKGEKNRAWLKENLGNYHILAQPSIYEGFGLTILEGIAAGLPIVASNIEGPAEILSNFTPSFLFNINDYEDCCEKLTELLGMYKNDLVDLYVNTAYSNVIEKYAISTTIKASLQLYHDIINV